MAKKNEKQADEATFEDALEDLESIVADLDGGRLPLTELVEQYEEGTRLLKVCRDRLAEARGKIEAIDAEALESGKEPIIGLEEAATASAKPVKKAKKSTTSGGSKQATSDDEVRLF